MRDLAAALTDNKGQKKGLKAIDGFCSELEPIVIQLKAILCIMILMN